MRLLYVVNAFPGSSETFVSDQIAGMIELGHNVTVVALRKGDAVNNQRVLQHKLLDRAVFLEPAVTARGALKGLQRLRAVGRPSRLLRLVDARLSATFRRNLLLASLPQQLPGRLPAADYIVAHFGSNGVLARDLRILGLITGRLATVFHGADLSKHKLLRKMTSDYRLLFQDGDLMLPISEYWRRALVELGCPVAKTAINRMGVDTDLFRFRSDRYASKGPILRIVTIGRLVEKKGVVDAVSAVRDLVRRGVKVSYDIFGDGPLRPELERHIAEFQLTECVHLHGSKPHHEVRERLDQAHVMLLPSFTAPDGDMEGIPVVLMEAMALGVVVVSTTHSGIPELVEHGAEGFLAPERNVPAIADALAYVAANFPAMGAVVERARSKVVRSFNQRDNYTALERLLMERLNYRHAA